MLKNMIVETMLENQEYIMIDKIRTETLKLVILEQIKTKSHLGEPLKISESYTQEEVAHVLDELHEQGRVEGLSCSKAVIDSNLNSGKLTQEQLAELYVNGKLRSNKIPITKEMTQWQPNLDTSLPIDGWDIPKFKKWINWNDTVIDKTRSDRFHHNGLDFAAYLNTDNKIILGLPPITPVRAIADGRVTMITLENSYDCGYIHVEHGRANCQMLSIYCHVRPLRTLRLGEIKKGDVIGTLYVDGPGEEGRLVHLHLGLLNGGTKEEIRTRMVERLQSVADILDPTFRDLTAEPQHSRDFKVNGLENYPIEVINFKKLLLK